MDSTLGDHVIGRVEERAGVLRDHKRLLDYLWNIGRPLVSKDFWRWRLSRQPGRQYRQAVYRGQHVVIVRTDQGCYVTYMEVH